MEQLATPGQIRDVEVMHHGCCLGLGLAAMATQRQDVASKLRDRLEATNAVIGEAASIGLGLVMLGSGDKDTYDCMYSFAKETQHEKIIRGIAVGSALLMYGRQEEADAQIEQLCGDEDPILRMAGCHTIATAYAGTDSNKVIKTQVWPAPSCAYLLCLRRWAGLIDNWLHSWLRLRLRLRLRVGFCHASGPQQRAASGGRRGVAEASRHPSRSPLPLPEPEHDGSSGTTPR